MISVQNYHGYHAFRLDDEKYSAYPYEKEFLLAEGVEVYVMKVEDVTTNNSSPGF